ncbi:hypothetical protein HRI_005198400 [Hibiscus trionum]|uniref:Splicing factor YJU2 n=1 Tax=Hibiscus trionum TaxID=183268 RepID=A0A9W7JH81_HIBTR|nr:hypothetical protein HRI_005198400 [Hibiscus trionum]
MRVRQGGNALPYIYTGVIDLSLLILIFSQTLKHIRRLSSLFIIVGTGFTRQGSATSSPDLPRFALRSLRLTFPKHFHRFYTTRFPQLYFSVIFDMAERKVLNKYFPPDFDPSMLPRVHRSKNQQMKVRMMLPMSIRCTYCGNYINKGTKLNSRKEDVTGDTYLGIQIFRFYFKCTKCSAEMTIKTHPKESDYMVESGATRRGEDVEAEKERQKRESEEMGDSMKSLENRRLDSKRKMDIFAALDELKSMKSRQATVSADAILEAMQRTAAEKEEDEALIKSIFQTSKEVFQRKRRRLSEEDSSSKDSSDSGSRQAAPFKSSVIIVNKPAKEEKTGLLSLCNYESDSD